ncbi:hypothetical protein HMPREF9336_02224 [Segniliparus rugosus ATCC BAA-974]|uniref:Lipoprotein n=2 Tax=Segniliparus rugosus TaxID=286804 RepID=E5XRV2_SEGRC|nr:hypothetical protein HMPREF9336_02224 [Segniliparus rugosus ATCC BAA-974]
MVCAISACVAVLLLLLGKTPRSRGVAIGCIIVPVVLAAAMLLAGCAPTAPPPPLADSESRPKHSVTTLDMKADPMTVSPSITSQRQAQEALYGYMRKTLQGLPEGVMLDNKRYGGYGGGSTAACDSERVDIENSPVDFADFRDMHTPPGTDYNALIARVGDIWKSWGWQVEERESDDKPSRYGHSSDGYSLRIQSAGSYEPTLVGSTPCFPAHLRDDSVPQPRVITKDRLLYDEPSGTPPTN